MARIRVISLVATMLLFSPPSSAGLFGTLSDGCRERYQIGQQLTVEFHAGRDYANNLDDKGVISVRTQESQRFQMKFIPPAETELEDKLKIYELPIDRLTNYNDQMIRGEVTNQYAIWLTATITYLDGSKDGVGCYLAAKFDGFKKGENVLIHWEERLVEEKLRKKQQDDLEQCKKDFDAMPKVEENVVVLNELTSRCPQISPSIEALKNEWRRSRLLAGKESIQNIEDAVLAHQPLRAGGVMAMPLLKPDNDIYFISAILDGEANEDLLRVKVFWGENNVAYGFLRIGGKTVIFNPNALRIESGIMAIGRYTRNIELRGGGKTAPVFDAMYVK